MSLAFHGIKVSVVESILSRAQKMRLAMIGRKRKKEEGNSSSFMDQ
jgi:hypothetical protein